jgi:hypothetical protein
MAYRIKPYSYAQAKKLGVTIKSSTVSGKKIDVFNSKGEKLASIGAIGYKDYPTFLADEGKEVADEKRRLYKLRHAKDRVVRGTAGFYADKILWTIVLIIGVQFV